MPGRLYHYRLVASNSTGSSEGEDRVMVAGAAPGSDAYREAVLATSGLASYRRLGELSGGSAADQLGGPPGSFVGRFLLGRPGVLGPLGDTAAGFDGASGELATPGPALAANATIEGWFRWWTGTTVLRDHSEAGGSGWLPAFNSGGTLRYRLGGSDFNTGMPIEDVRDGTWHHIVATKSGASTRLYLDGAQVHAGAGAGSEPATAPWHVMRNGTRAVFSEGDADELALYTRALTAGEVRSHFDLARALATQPLPPETPAPAAEPPAAGAGLGGGVLRPVAPRARTPVGSASVRRGRLVVVGAARRANRIVARRKGAAWQVSDAAAALRAGAGCRRLTARTVTCRAVRVTGIALYGGNGNDRLTVIGRIRSPAGGRAREGPAERRPKSGLPRRPRRGQDRSAALSLAAAAPSQRLATPSTRGATGNARAPCGKWKPRQRSSRKPARWMAARVSRLGWQPPISRGQTWSTASCQRARAGSRPRTCS